MKELLALSEDFPLNHNLQPINMMVFNNSVPAFRNQFSFWELADAYYLCMFTHSIRQLSILGNFTPESIFIAMQKSFEICNLIGVNAKHHYKKVFVYDAQMGVTSIDWLMSKKGYNLMKSQLRILKSTFNPNSTSTNLLPIQNPIL